ncbi:hypothetical protein [Microbacterium sp. Mcb102]|uniref:hypothetical protein n=1 Tax=Microbacterium sp. Mcb102 TaxID=2926012 RepID=UPI0021CA6781|nr:hypothetical protein [Microbacterium sp. Mcb102]
MTTSEILQKYTPNLPAGTWAQMRDHVLSTVGSLPLSPSAQRYALTHLTGFLDWVLGISATPLNDALRADLIDAYTEYRHLEVRPNVAERERKVLRDLAGLPRRVEHRTRTTSSPADIPYTSQEQQLIRLWAAFQPTELQQRNASALAVLSLGCGLTAAEAMAARVQDIVLDADGPCIVAPERVVPAAHDWGDVLRDLDGCGHDDEFLVAPKRTMRSAASVLEDLRRSGTGDIVPTPQRMRNTWLVERMNAGVPLQTVVWASGLTTAHSLLRLIPHTRAQTPDERTRSLGGTR